MTATQEPKSPVTTAEKLAELRTRLELAKEPGGEKAVAKRAKKGIPSARARSGFRSCGRSRSWGLPRASTR